ncbi:MAG TPA: LCP family protein [Gaiellaceae bacterium]|nr:LCP family protein [Gaiellaceae bacterium]
MRTTLKRGIGLVAGHNGNGHSAAPPLFGPIVRYRQPDPPQRSVIGLLLRGFGWLLLAVVVIAAGAAGGLYLYGHESLNAVAAKDQSLKKAETNGDLKVPIPSQPAIALVAGYDFRAGTGAGGSNPYAGSNSDTLMLLRADPKHDTLSMLSFPRDLWVPIYCHSGAPFTVSRINSAWQLCGNNGPAATLQTMEHLTGLKINYMITLDFHAFKQIVNHLHGVYMNVDRRYYIAPHSGTSAINLQPGYQKLDGGQALAYVRYRHTDSDIYRTGRQQLFLEALKSRLRTGLSIFEAPKLISDLKKNVAVARGGSGSVTAAELESYLGLAYHLPAGHLFRNQIPLADFHYFTAAGGAQVESASAGAISGAVYRFLHPDVRESQTLNNQYSGHRKTAPKKKTPKLPKSRISVLVLNAGTVPGEAANTSYLLTTDGFTTKTLPANESANAPKHARDTTVYYDPVQPDAQQAAQQIRPLFGSQTRVEQMTTAIAAYARRAGNPLTVVTVGTGFSGKLAVPHHVKVPKRRPPQVSNGAAMTAPALRRVYDRVHFPLMVPHKIAQYAQLSPDEGVRAFKVNHQHEVALTFVMPNQIEYWQVEESTWNRAPILENPTGHIYYHGEKLQIYSTGGTIQMVALPTKRATYWVVNTILNQLSNSTMIAIAESFRPLRR